MGLKTFTITLADLSKDSYLRFDEKYHSFLLSSDWNLFASLNKKLIPLKDILDDDYNLFDYQEDEEYKGIPTGQTYVDEDGEIIEFQPVNAENHPGRLKYKVSNDNILISSLRLAKSPALFFDKVDLSEYIFSNGFYIFKANDDWNNKFVLYILRTKKLKDILDNHIYRGIGISAYKKEDLLKIKIPLISKPKQDLVVAQIEPIEKKIKLLKAQITPPQEVMNKVFAREFCFDLETVNEVERIKYFTIDTDITFRNRNLRSSVRWNKINPIQQMLYKNNQYIEKLGNFIVSTKNGWSPNCKETDTENAVFGVNSISKDGCINFEDLKYSDENKNKIEEYFVKEDDLFVSRGNTVDLVALASVVKNLPDEQNYIFPDLFIKIELDSTQLDKEYLALIFNSVIGRYYFKYSAKGKNQTMVKISSEELKNFFIPVPPLKSQQKIVDEIKAELNKQEEIKSKIENERNKIDEIIESAIKL